MTTKHVTLTSYHNNNGYTNLDLDVPYASMLDALNALSSIIGADLVDRYWAELINGELVNVTATYSVQLVGVPSTMPTAQLSSEPLVHTFVPKPGVASDVPKLGMENVVNEALTDPESFETSDAPERVLRPGFNRATWLRMSGAEGTDG